jgi:hypothetical protein
MGILEDALMVLLDLTAVGGLFFFLDGGQLEEHQDETQQEGKQAKSQEGSLDGFGRGASLLLETIRMDTNMGPGS